ncbi:VOC family protein [Actinomadura sp. NPDC000929]|uniref:VOC family protein n=1 Tax=Actinomadura sp. NPDC000929 TaxID=3154517 RepID=UPI00339ACEE4
MAESVTMKANRSVPSATVIPVLIYPDVRAAVAWLAAAFGFVEGVRTGEGHRAQFQVDDGAVIVGDVHGDRRAPLPDGASHSMMVRVEDIDAHCAHAREHGARIVTEPTDFEYGERQYTATDLAGRRWTFSETLADRAPEDWGGESITP